MRGKYKRWRNGPGGRWTARITWYCEGGQGDEPITNIRLQLETEEGRFNEYPATVAEAEVIWNRFKLVHSQTP